MVINDRLKNLKKQSLEIDDDFSELNKIEDYQKEKEEIYLNKNWIKMFQNIESLAEYIDAYTLIDTGISSSSQLYNEIFYLGTYCLEFEFDKNITDCNYLTLYLYSEGRKIYLGHLSKKYPLLIYNHFYDSYNTQKIIKNELKEIIANWDNVFLAIQENVAKYLECLVEQKKQKLKTDKERLGVSCLI